MPHHGQNPFVSVILSRPGAALRQSRGSQGSQRSPDPPKATGGGRTEPRAWCPCFHLVLPRFLVRLWGTSCNCLLLASAKPVPFLVPVELRRRMCPAPSAFGKRPPGPAGSPFSVCFELLAAWPPQWPVFLARQSPWRCRPPQPFFREMESPFCSLPGRAAHSGSRTQAVVHCPLLACG